MKVLGAIACVIGFVVLITGVSFWAQGTDFFLYQMFAPKYEQVRRNTFEQSKAYTQGMIQQLRQQQMAYVQADAAHKDALASIILHDYADYPDEQLPSDLYAFMQQLRHDYLNSH